MASSMESVTASQNEQLQDIVTIASVNFRSVSGNAEANLEKMRGNVVEAAAQGADLVLFPEGSLLGCSGCLTCKELGGPCELCKETSETVPGPSSEVMAELAKEHDLYIIYGLRERDAQDPDKLYNAAAVIGPEGILGSYRKVHLGEPPWVTEGITNTPGTELPLFQTRFGPIGVQICYDFWFNPELTRLLAPQRSALNSMPGWFF